MNGSLKNIAVDVLSKMGCSVTVSDLYALKFNAATTRNDITGKCTICRLWNDSNSGESAPSGVGRQN